MARPASTKGGRPTVVSVRLSDDEAADLDSRRGNLNRGDYLRLLLAHDHERHERGDLAVRSNTDELRVLREKRQGPEQVFETAPPEKTVPLNPGHRHRPGEIIRTWFEQGKEQVLYRCNEPGCGETIQR